MQPGRAVAPRRRPSSRWRSAPTASSSPSAATIPTGSSGSATSRPAGSSTTLTGHRAPRGFAGLSPRRPPAAQRELGLHGAPLGHGSTGKPVGDILKHTDLVQAVAFSPDGTLALTGGDDYTSRLWHVPSGKPLGQPHQHPDKVEAVAFSRRGHSSPPRARAGAWLRDLATGHSPRPALAARRRNSLAGVPRRGPNPGSGSWNGEVRTWPVPDGRRKWTCRGCVAALRDPHRCPARPPEGALVAA